LIYPGLKAGISEVLCKFGKTFLAIPKTADVG